jgi:class 3 adenylate cyclase
VAISTQSPYNIVTGFSMIQNISSGVQLLFTMLAMLAFVMYDKSVQRSHQELVLQSAQATDIISSMFPEKLRQQLLEVPSASSKASDVPFGDACAMDEERGTRKSSMNTIDTTSSSSSSLMTTDLSLSASSAPIAELYPETTVMLADLAGFTAWSADRDPMQVFLLLESIFLEFDRLAARRDVYKVETVGDCYVAVAGLPDPRPDHAVVMACFARDCMLRFANIAAELEPTLGGTSDLGLRIGLHSGPITGGVLRGDRRRFQLFGDTINTAARMESNSFKGRVQVSETTAQLLMQAKKQRWLIQREDPIDAKGKGHLQTYWLDIHAKSASVIGSSIDGVV